jgi:flagellar hook-associated protein 3 FlgL
MRISTSQKYQMAVQAMLTQQATLAKTQNQVATGKRVQTPSDDPVAAVQINNLAQAQSANQQFGKNNSIATTRLQLEEQALNDTTTVTQRVRELVLQANTATLNSSDRQSIATELKARQDELVAIANRKDSNGEYLFGGLSGGTQPFVAGANGAVKYVGDSGARSVQVDASLSVQDSDPGNRLFMDIPAGNGTFTASATATNTGSGALDVGTVVNASQWVPDSYTVKFGAAGAWTATDSSGTQVGSGTYTGAAGSTISFRGIQLGLSGSPAANDTFTVAPSGTQDVFSTISGAIAALQSPVGNDAQRAQFTTTMNATLQQLDQVGNNVSQVHAQVGARLSMLSDSENARQNALTDLKTESGSLSDLDYASAVASLSQQQLGLQAAQAAFATTSKLSLFSYL